jgi:hypothetical protein
MASRIDHLAFASHLKWGTVSNLPPAGQLIVSKCEKRLFKIMTMYREETLRMSLSARMRCCVHGVVNFTQWLFLLVMFIIAFQPSGSVMIIFACIAGMALFLKTYENILSVIQRDNAYFALPLGPVDRAKAILDNPAQQKSVDLYHGLMCYDWVIAFRLYHLFPKKWDSQLEAAYLHCSTVHEDVFISLTEDELIRTLCLRVIYECLTSS